MENLNTLHAVSEILLNVSPLLLGLLLVYGLYLAESLPNMKNRHHDNMRGSHFYETNKKWEER